MDKYEHITFVTGPINEDLCDSLLKALEDGYEIIRISTSFEKTTKRPDSQPFTGPVQVNLIPCMIAILGKLAKISLGDFDD